MSTPQLELHNTLFVLCSNQARLRSQGLLPRAKEGTPASTPQQVRFSLTWHQNPLPAKWISAVGCWGAVGTFAEICNRCGTGISSTKSFMARYNLEAASGMRAPGSKVRQRQPRQPQHLVALESYLRWNSRDAQLPMTAAVRHIAAGLHLLPVELKLYFGYVQEILQAREILEIDADISAARADLAEIIAEEWEPYAELLRNTVGYTAG